MREIILYAIVVLFTFSCTRNKENSTSNEQPFVKQREGFFEIDGKPYYFIGTNFWYGPILGSTRRRPILLALLLLLLYRRWQILFLVGKRIRQLRFGNIHPRRQQCSLRRCHHDRGTTSLSPSFNTTS